MTERHSLYSCPGTSACPGSQLGMGEIPSANETDRQQMVRFTQVHLLIQVLTQVWEKSHRQVSRTGSIWPCDCTHTSTCSGSQPGMGVTHQQMRQIGSRWSCTFTRSGSQPGMGVPHRQMRRTGSRWLYTFAHPRSLARHGSIPSAVETDRQQKIFSQTFRQNKFIKTTFNTFRDDRDTIDVQMKPR